MRRLKTFITLALAVAFAGCTPEENPAGNTDFDVRLDIPAEIVLEADAKSVEFTVVDGKELYRDGKFLTCDYDALCAELKAIHGWQKQN